MSVSGSSELGLQLEHLFKLFQNLLAPKGILFQKVAGARAGKLGPAEQGQQIVRHFNCACREHGSTMAALFCRGNRDISTIAQRIALIILLNIRTIWYFPSVRADRRI